MSADAPLAQLDRVFGYEPKGRGFESLTACQKEHICNQMCFFRYILIEGIRLQHVFSEEINQMKITSLLENTTKREDLKTEHGLSLYVETEDHTILFDMGQTDLLFENAKVLGIDLAKVDLAILSHGHYDHGGGLGKFLKINSQAPVYVHKDAFLPHYNGTDKYIGLDPTLKDHPRLFFTDGNLSMGGSLSLISRLSRSVTPPPSSLTERIGNEFVAEDFRHEQYLLIEEKGKRVLISGCSHRGILTITEEFVPDVLVGGFHFSKLPTDRQLSEAARRLSTYPTDFYTCHCTGQAQYHWMQRDMPRLRYLSCGQTIQL